MPCIPNVERELSLSDVQHLEWKSTFVAHRLRCHGANPAGGVWHFDSDLCRHKDRNRRLSTPATVSRNRIITHKRWKQTGYLQRGDRSRGMSNVRPPTVETGVDSRKQVFADQGPSEGREPGARELQRRREPSRHNLEEASDFPVSSRALGG
jgi:hypothetical protein